MLMEKMTKRQGKRKTRKRLPERLSTSKMVSLMMKKTGIPSYNATRPSRGLKTQNKEGYLSNLQKRKTPFEASMHEAQQNEGVVKEN